jgi:hypothetical protein
MAILLARCMLLLMFGWDGERIVAHLREIGGGGR